MSNPDGVLASIDACLDDYELSDDAMRRAPDEPDPTPQSDPAGWRRRLLSPGMLTWPSTIARAGEALHLEPAEDAPGPVQSACRGASAAGAVFDEYVMAAHPRIVALNEFVRGLQHGAQVALGGFGKAFGPTFTAIQSSLHREGYRGVQGHKRRCPTCNPYAFPKPLAIDGREYNRRRRRRRR